MLPLSDKYHENASCSILTAAPFPDACHSVLPREFKPHLYADDSQIEACSPDTTCELQAHINQLPLGYTTGIS